jgi:hypothetical protein
MSADQPLRLLPFNLETMSLISGLRKIRTASNSFGTSNKT